MVDFRYHIPRRYRATYAYNTSYPQTPCPMRRQKREVVAVVMIPDGRSEYR
jgi:hypothetical protein